MVDLSSRTESRSPRKRRLVPRGSPRRRRQRLPTKADLGVVGLAFRRTAIHEQRRTVAAGEEQVVLDRLRGERQPDLLLEELLTPRQVGRTEHRGHPPHLHGRGLSRHRSPCGRRIDPVPSALSQASASRRGSKVAPVRCYSVWADVASARGFPSWTRNGEVQAMSTFPQAEKQRTGRVSPIIDYLNGLLERFAPLDDGAVATYIPELARSDPADFGICIVTLDGAVYEVGDTRVPFTIQSMSKPLTYGLALERLGRRGRAPPRRRGAERRPVQRDQPRSRDGRAGEPDDQCRGDRLRRAGCRARRTPARAPARRLLPVRRTAARARRGRLPLRERRPAIATARSPTSSAASSCSTCTPEEAVDLYFRQCAISVDCRDLALIASTLANGGINPVSRERGGRRGSRSRGAERDDDLRDVRRGRRLADVGGHPGQERRLGRGVRGSSRAPGNRCLLPGARRARQQRPRGRRLSRALTGSRASPRPARRANGAVHPRTSTRSERSGRNASAPTSSVTRSSPARR